MTNYTGTSGDDTLVGSTGNDNIGGLEGNDLLIGLAGNDMLVGDAGDDTFYGGSGNDGLFGGSGNDTADYEGSLAAVTVRLEDGNAYGGDAQGDTLFEIENVVGSGYDDTIAGDGFENKPDGGDGDDGIAGLGGEDFLSGGAGNDTIDGGLNDDTLDGGAGSDALLGGDGTDALKGAGGADRLYGGDGFDFAGYNESATAVTVSLAEGSGSGGDAEGDLLMGIEALMGSSFGDGLTGDAENNYLIGLSGDDRLNGLAGSDLLSGDEGKDVLDGGTGADTMTGGDGDDVYRVDDISDIVDELNATGTDLVESAISFSLSNTARVTGTLEKLTLLGKANIDGTGNDLANTIVGNAGDNKLDGKGGADTLHGRAGNDTYVVDNTGDVVDESGAGSAGIDLIVSNASFSLSDMTHVKGQVENLTLTGTANIDGTGNELANVVIGNAGANVLSGLGGNDTLTGGAGADQFVFDTALSKKANVDTITDFGADDTIVLAHEAFGKLRLGALKVKAFHEGKEAHDGNDRVIYNPKNGSLVYDKNGDDRGGAIKFAVLDKDLDLGKADFLVI